MKEIQLTLTPDIVRQLIDVLDKFDRDQTYFAERYSKQPGWYAENLRTLILQQSTARIVALALAHELKKQA